MEERQMIRRIFGFLAAGLLLPLIFLAGAARAETGVKFGDAAGSGSVDVGVQQKKISGSSEKFEEYRDVENGFLVNDASFRIENDKSRYFIDVKIKNPVQENEFYSLTGGKHGSFKYKIFFDSIPTISATASSCSTGQARTGSPSPTTCRTASRRWSRPG
jgi:hypothetical protein